MSHRHFRKNLEPKPQCAAIGASAIVDYGDTGIGWLQPLIVINGTISIHCPVGSVGRKYSRLVTRRIK